MNKQGNGMKSSISHDQGEHLHDEDYGRMRARDHGKGKGNGPVFPVRSEPPPDPKVNTGN